MEQVAKKGISLLEVPHTPTVAHTPPHTHTHTHRVGEIQKGKKGPSGAFGVLSFQQISYTTTWKKPNNNNNLFFFFVISFLLFFFFNIL